MYTIGRVCLKKLDFSALTDVDFLTSSSFTSKKAPKKDNNFCQDIPVVVISTKKFVFIDLKNVSLPWSKVQLKKFFHKNVFFCQKMTNPKKMSVFWK